MKNYKKVYAAFILAGGLILHGCNGIFDDLSINPNQPSMGAYFTSPSAVKNVHVFFLEIQVQPVVLQWK